MSGNLKTEILNLLPKFESESDLRHLYCELLNYEYVDVPVPTRDWATLAREVTEYGRVIAKRSSFYVAFLQIKKLTMTNERSVLNEILKRYPECVVVFYGIEDGHWHIVSPKFDPETPHKFLIRRYVVGPHERLRTAAERLSLTYAVDDDSSARIKEKHDDAFNVEAVTREFFETYKEVLNAVKNDLFKQRKMNEQTAHAFSQQLLNRLMFLYFVQKKGWLNKDSHFIKNLWAKYERLHSINDNFYEAWIEPLFFYSFNKKQIPPKYDLPKEFVEIYGKMPFLNGGLFTRNELDDVGFRVKDSHMRLIIDGLLERFNFTIREDLPFDVEVAVDPEMLGKVYESLVLEEERGKSGIFYTPRIEVDFMCRQAIIEHLVETTGIPYETVISFVWAEPTAETPKVGREELRIIRDALWNVKIVDPACGSGAFLVGIMHVLFDFHRRIATEFGEVIDEFEIKRRIIQENLFGVDIKPWAIRVAELRLWLTLIVNVDESKIDLYSKPLLPNLTFKLRVGDSLVQELAGKQISVRAMYNRLPLGVRGALQELIQLKRDYYYGKESMQISERIKEKEIDILSNIIKDRLREIDIKLKTLAGVQQRFANAVAISEEEKHRNQEKEKIEAEREELEKTLNALKEARTLFFWEIDFAEVFANGGFDIVIGNPPYVRYQSIAPVNLPPEKQTYEVRKIYKEKTAQSVKVHWGDEFQQDMKSDYYIYFFYHGLSLLKPGGTFCFITSNSWLDVQFGFKFQRFLLRNIEIKAVYDNQAKKTFFEADINTVISIFKRPKSGLRLSDNILRFVAFRKPFENVLNKENILDIQLCFSPQSNQEYRCFPTTQMELWQRGLFEVGKQITFDGNTFVGEHHGESWGGIYLRAPDVFLDIRQKAKDRLVRLGEIAEIETYLNTLGSDNFFFVSLIGRKKSTSIIRSRIEGKEFEVENEFLTDFIESPKELQSITINGSFETKLFRIPKEIKGIKSKKAYSYVLFGKRKGFQTRLPAQAYSGRKILIACYMGANHIIYFNPREIISHRFFRVNQKRHGEEKKLALLLNSTLTSLSLELFRNPGLGAGVLAHGTYTIREFMIPNPDMVDLNEKDFDAFLKRRIGSVFEECGIDPERPIREQEPKPPSDRKELDNIVFDVLGLTLDERKEVYWSACELVKSRLEKAASLSR